MRLPCGHCHGHPSPSPEDTRPLATCEHVRPECLYYDRLHSLRNEGLLWERRRGQQELMPRVLPSAYVSRKAVTAVRTPDTNEERGKLGWVQCDVWSRGLGVPIVTSRVCDSLVSGAEWLWLCWLVSGEGLGVLQRVQLLQTSLHAVTQPVSAKWAQSLLTECQLSQFCENKKPALSSQLASPSTPRPGLDSTATLGLKDRIFAWSQLPVLVSIQSVFVRRAGAQSWSYSF